MEKQVAYRMAIFGCIVSFLEEYGYYIKDDIRVQQNAKMRDFLKAAKALTYKLEKDLPSGAESFGEDVKGMFFELAGDIEHKLMEDES